MSTAGNIGRVVALAVAVAAGGVGAHLYETKGPRASLQRALADAETQLQGCTQARDEARRAHDAMKLSAAERAQELDASRTELEDLRHQKEDTEKRLALFRA